MGQETHSIQFFNRDGGGMFKIFLGRDEQRRIDEAQLTHFRELGSRLVRSSQPAVPTG